jgi:hypothetical protein
MENRKSRRARQRTYQRSGRKYHEEKLTRLEETREPALEMAQEKNAETEESTEDAQAVISDHSVYPGV